MTTIESMGKKAKEVARVLATAGSLKDKALLSIADALIENTDYILEENAKDLQAGKDAGLSESLLDRLALSEERIRGMAEGARQVASLPDPCGRILTGSKLKNGLEVSKVTVPLGVIGIIYEARPNVTADSAVLCLKSGNAVILRGGKEAINSNKAVATVMRKAIELAGLPADCVQLIEDTTRQSSIELMGLSDYLDVLIPRGGAGLIKATVENAKVPVIETGTGNCHVYVDEFADKDMAAEIIFNAKTSRPSVCNAIETILVHRNIAKEVLPLIKAKLDEKNVELRGCEKTIEILGDSVKPASEEDYATEFLDYILAVKVVNCIDCALNHIAKFSSGHSECIVTENYTNAEKFLNSVDAAAVYVNASTRFTDGGEFGLGAEIGISTQKLHARGPMGIAELTSVKFVVKGNGQVR
ncbi:MAG: glutamate-5-semialdehyde dehydrogenase [Clostridia bacterium]|nr:glutamate-5-semialdehyde dehydrogenase [Clostridia bacterium]